MAERSQFLRDRPCTRPVGQDAIRSHRNARRGDTVFRESVTITKVVDIKTRSALGVESHLKNMAVPRQTVLAFD